ncbi:MAG TPA: translation elongation factor-like protein [Dehalococcoidia bacterium]|nr:translation elongation factor-like protein [Dehalococcoidia bacterium]
MEREIGRVTHYFSHLNVAALDLSEPISLGDTIHFKGHTTDFTQTVEHLQIEHKDVQEAVPGDDVALQVREHVREHDRVYKLA